MESPKVKKEGRARALVSLRAMPFVPPRPLGEPPSDPAPPSPPVSASGPASSSEASGLRLPPQPAPLSRASGFRRAYDRCRPYVPALAFFGGFLWDALTLGRAVGTLDLLLLLGYLLGAGLILLVQGREIRFRFSEYLNLLLQFFFGGIFSALLIFYFLSASAWPGLLFTGFLALLLIANEFLGSRYGRLTLSFAFFAFSSLMFFNFALPHLFRSLHPVFFFLAAALALGLLFALRALSRPGIAKVTPAALSVLAVVVLHLFRLLPPVPLVKKEMVIWRDYRFTDGVARGLIEKPAFYDLFKRSERTAHLQPGEKLYCYSAIFLPPGIETRLYHRWWRFDPGAGEWKKVFAVGFPVQGGRRGGYRAHSRASKLVPGRYKVTVETEAGAVVGLHRFTVKRPEAGAALEFREVRLP